MLTFMMVMLLTGGYFLYSEAEKLNDFELEYGTFCETSTIAGTCRVQFVLETDLKNPAVYYRLDKFYHNHRSFIRSRDWK
jgi:hypothetical protein